MQIKIFTIPIMGDEKLLEEMNAFLPSKKILQVEQHLVQEVGGGCSLPAPAGMRSKWRAPARCHPSGELELATKIGIQA